MGPLTHYACVQQGVKLVKQLGLNLNVGSILDAIEPDILQLPGHGYDFLTGSGGVFNNMEAYYEAIRKKLQRGDKNISREFRILCHWTGDAHEIGHLSNQFWGSLDTRVEGTGDLVSQKDKNSLTLRRYASKAAIRAEVYKSSKAVYDAYKSKVKSWSFLFSNDLKNMVRNSVQKGAEFAAAYVYLAQKK